MRKKSLVGWTKCAYFLDGKLCKDNWKDYFVWNYNHRKHAELGAYDLYLPTLSKRLRHFGNLPEQWKKRFVKVRITIEELP